MKIRFFLLTTFLCSVFSLFAGNTITTVEQVSESITLTDDVDYVITSTTPFATTGSVNIQNTEHAVVILKNIKPSRTISNYLKYIRINGATAQNDVNCQVKMYAQGAIIFPYGSDFKPLTCYTEPNFGGTSCNDYAEGSTGGYMNTLSTAQLNNQIRSFKLKRGYMVTFAVGQGGWGYSRCFIADQEDLEFTELPNVLDGRISSFRLFKWWNAQKKGLGSDTRMTANSALNSSWCYDWGTGSDTNFRDGNGTWIGNFPDTEWVPNHIYEDYPSSAACGSRVLSCHMKTNNEPRNSADDHPQDLETILDNWQNLMRTGMRLCSPSSWDGSDYWNGTGFIKSFLEEIDARGWRCDVVDAHCYWPDGNFGYLQSLWWPSMHRPIWISEWIWGASWNGNGCFAPNQTDENIYNTTVAILNTLNNSPAIERYAYWNSESKGHIYESGLTALGEYYAEMESGLGYNKNYEFIPTVVYNKPSIPTGTYTKSDNTFVLNWSDPNGDMLDEMTVQRKSPGTTVWKDIATISLKDKNSSAGCYYTYTDIITEPGLYYYRISDRYEGNSRLYSDDISVTISASQSVGLLQYGQLKIASDEFVITDIEPQTSAPYIVTGFITNKNTANGITNQIQGQSGRTTDYSSFKFRFYPWQLTTPVTFNNAENADYMILPQDTVMHLSADMMLISQKAGSINGNETQIVFPEAFPDGVTPVVVAQQKASTTQTTAAPVTVKVYDITNTGFKVKLVRQEGETGTIAKQTVYYFAATPGQIAIGQGKLLTVGRNNNTPVGGSGATSVALTSTDGTTMHFLNPCIVAGSQTNNYEKASIFRVRNTSSDTNGIYAINIRRQTDGTSTVTTTDNAATNGDYIGWFIISDDPNGTGTEDPIIVPTGIDGVRNNPGFNVSVDKGVIYANGKNLRAYSVSGHEIRLGEKQPKGLYIVTDGKQSIKVQVK
ncbi:MAG: hypothetical protein J6Y39_06825 [Bacteroidaceae bacterium]|nr:hypothetical protein [Bacteroidaceae bacterium]